MQDLPSHSADAERALIGAMLRSIDAIAEARALLPTEAYYFDAHQKIADAICSLDARSCRVDLVTVVDELTKSGKLDDVGGQVYLADLWQGAPTAWKAEHYAEIILEKYRHRSLSHLLRDVLGQLDAGSPPDDAATDLSSGIDRVFEAGSLNGHTIQESGTIVMANIDARSRGERPATLSTGFCQLDEVLCGGLRNGGLTVLAARTSRGKTALALTIARNICSGGKAVFFVSLEQSHEEIVERHFSAIADVSGRRIILGDLLPEHGERIIQAHATIQPWKFVVEDRRNLSASQIASMARRHVRRFHCPTLIVIDYLSLIRAEDAKAQRYFQVGETVKRLRAMAGDLGVPVLLLAQLNRQAVDHDLPEVRHIRESGDVEQDADAILLLHQETDVQGAPTESFRLMVAKQRNGPTADVMLRRHAATFDFTEESAIPV